MDYEKAYKAVLQTATQWIKDGCTDKEKICLECVFPELRESDDEKARKKCIELIKRVIPSGDSQSQESKEILDCIAYLEKQKEQKPAEWSEVELEFRGEKVTVKRPFYRDDKGRGYSTAELDEEVAWNALRAWCEKKGISLYDLYPKAEWSKEDEMYLSQAIETLEHENYSILADKLKSLRPQPKQEWSEEDEKMLTGIIARGRSQVPYYDPALREEQMEWLMNRLKSLRPYKK